WNGVFVPHGTPREIVAKLNAALNAALASPAVAPRFKALNIDWHPTTPEEFGRFVEEQTRLWGGIVQEANIKLGGSSPPRQDPGRSRAARRRRDRHLAAPPEHDDLGGIAVPLDHVVVAVEQTRDHLRGRADISRAGRRVERNRAAIFRVDFA